MSWVSRRQMQPFSSFFIQLMSSREHTGTVVLTMYTVLSAQDGSSRTGKCLRRTSKWLYFEVAMNYLVLSVYLAVCRYQVCVFFLNPCKNPFLQPPKRHNPSAHYYRGRQISMSSKPA